MKSILKLSAIFAIITNTCLAAENLIFDHDGGVDDFVALTLTSCDPKYNIKAITVMPADSFKKTAVEVSEKISNLAGLTTQISASDFAGTNPFPDEWRKHSDYMTALPFFSNAPYKSSNKSISLDSHLHLVELLSKNEKYDIIAVGPLSNIAEALKINPKIKNNISHLYIMGGAVKVIGNVADKDHDKTAEWNIYNNPEAADVVIKSGIPITLVPLDATQYVPVNSKFMDKLNKQKNVASRVVHDISQVLGKFIESEGVFFWDTLTAAVAIDPSIMQASKMKVKVIVDGKSQGRTIESTDGHEVRVAQKADKDKLEKLILDRLSSCKWDS